MRYGTNPCIVCLVKNNAVQNTIYTYKENVVSHDAKVAICNMSYCKQKGRDSNHRGNWQYFLQLLLKERTPCNFFA